MTDDKIPDNLLLTESVIVSYVPNYKTKRFSKSPGKTFALFGACKSNAVNDNLIFLIKPELHFFQNPLSG